MITISACLIVKNEEKVLARCLESLKDISDEIIIVDTGSTDKTKEIAAAYTNKIYDFPWIDDFSAARNFSFKKAEKEYIYAADADEVIDEENRKKFLLLKQSLLPEVEIVQMYYSNQLTYNTTYNFDKEYRPKLYKRLRTFRWQEPIHESVCLEPIIYDSDIIIHHCPLTNHSKRDFKVFQHVIKSQGSLSKKLRIMYAKELLIAGEAKDFLEAEDYFFTYLEKEAASEEEIKQCQCILSRCARIREDKEMFFKHCLKNIALDKPSSEVCYELGEYYFSKKDYKEATIWYYNAAYETEPELALKYAASLPLYQLSKCYAALGDLEQKKSYESLAKAAAVQPEP